MTEQSAIIEDKQRSDKEREGDAAQKQDVNPDLILLEPAKADRTKPVQFWSLTMPQPIANFVYDFNDTVSNARFHVLKMLPNFIVNNSSNAIGATQLVGEALYFKSSGVNKFIKDEHKGTWKAFVYPPVNVVEGVFKKSAFQVKWKDLLNPKHMWEEVTRFVNLEEASKVDLQHTGKLSNRWSARSGFAGMFSMSVATALPEDKDDPAIKEKMVNMATNNPIGYAGYRIGKGLMFPITAPVRIAQDIVSPNQNHHIGDGKREFAGIGMTLTGFFSVLAGFRQPRELNGTWRYGFNKWQALGGMITTFAGGQLLMGVDNQQGWTNYGATQFLRLLVLPQSIRERFKDKQGFSDPNAPYYFGAQGVFQTKNAVAVMIGGAEKLPDGTILDQKKVRDSAKEKIVHASQQGGDAKRSVHAEEVPDTQIQQVGQHLAPDKSLAKAT